MTPRRWTWGQRWILRAVEAWLSAHGLTVVDADATAAAAIAALDLERFAQSSGHLTRVYHAGRRVQQGARDMVNAIVRAGARTW